MPAWSAFRQALNVGTLKIEVQPDGPGGMARLLLGEYWAVDGSPIEEGIVLERPRRATVESASTASPGAEPAAAPGAAPSRARPPTAASPRPAVSLPAT